jgi:hypothetical protein
MTKFKVMTIAGVGIAVLMVAAYIISGGITGSVTPMPSPDPNGGGVTATPTTYPNQVEPTATSPSEVQTGSPTQGAATASPSVSPTSDSSSAPPTASPTSGSSTNPPSPTSSPSNPGGSTNTAYISNSTTVIQELAANKENHEEPEDYVWNNSEVINIVLNGNSIIVNPSGNVTVNGTKATILSAGTYRITGTLTDGQIVVNTQDEGTVRLIFSGVNIGCSTNAPLYIMNAHKTVLVLEENSENRASDGANYVLNNSEEDEPNAAIFSKSDLTIFGNGTLVVDANYNDGIASKDGLLIKSGTINVESVDDGIRGRDYLVVKNGNINLTVDGVGLKSDNDENDARGYILVENGEIRITSTGDAIEGETDVLITGGNFRLTSGGGSSGTITGTSAKGIKASVCIIIEGGTFVENTSDDAINSNGKVTINGGSFSISTGDDAVHADAAVVIRGGDINVTKSYEGIESTTITINNGNIHIISSDDGLNIAGGKDQSGIGQGPRGDAFRSGTYHLYINGGYTFVNANGDGIDSNGAITMTGGQVIVDGPTSFMNVAVDHDSPFNMTGGFLLGVGSSGSPIAPAQAPNSISTQYSVLVNFNSAKQAGTLIHIQTSNGTEICTFKPTKGYQSIVLSSADLMKGTTYDIYYGGTSTGTLVDGIYQSGTYTSGVKYSSFTISTIVTRIT